MRTLVTLVAISLCLGAVVMWCVGNPPPPLEEYVQTTTEVQKNKSVTTVRKVSSEQQRSFPRSAPVTLAALGGGLLLLILVAFPDRSFAFSAGGNSGQIGAEDRLARLFEAVDPSLKKQPRRRRQAVTRMLTELDEAKQDPNTATPEQIAEALQAALKGN